MAFKPGKWGLPIAWLYGSLMQLRNWAYDKGYIRSLSFTPVVISWGNLSVGGTGKSPHTEYLTQLLLADHQSAILSRGYGRKTKGFLLASHNETAASVGDEPWQYYLRFQDTKVKVAVCERRAEGIPLLLLDNPDLDCIILDDAFQHRRVKPAINLLLTTFQHPFWLDEVIPAGWLREPKIGAQRADALVISKCPENLTLAERNRLVLEAQAFLKSGTPVFFSRFSYGRLKPVASGAEIQDFTKAQNVEDLVSTAQVGAFCGIAMPSPFREAVENLLAQPDQLIAFEALNDHQPFSQVWLDEMEAKSIKMNIQCWICTAKDQARLLEPGLSTHPFIKRCYYLPVTVSFLDHLHVEAFDSWILTEVAAKIQR